MEPNNQGNPAPSHTDQIIQQIVERIRNGEPRELVLEDRPQSLRNAVDEELGKLEK